MMGDEGGEGRRGSGGGAGGPRASTDGGDDREGSSGGGDAFPWRRVEELFDRARALPPDELEAFLTERCGSDARLREEVLDLLSASEGAEDYLRGLARRSGVPSPPAPDGEQDVDAGRLANRRVGAYRLLRLLGRGGMGAVYLAERADGRFEKRVAVKLLPLGMATPSMWRRFQEERRVLARVEHPNVARLLDGGLAEDGTPYFVMEYVDGMPIDRFCSRHGLEVRERLELFLQVVEAVAAAHRHGIVHRDLKPANILVDGEGRVRLLDFGVAKPLDAEGDGAPSTLTRLGGGPLTPRYASPEQLRGEPVTTATDVYSLGVLLYELLTDRPPLLLEGLAPEALRARVCAEEPEPPTRLCPDLDRSLDAVALRALHKDPARRYPSAAALRTDVLRHLEGQPVHARRPSSVGRALRRLRRWRLGPALGATAALALAAWLLVPLPLGRGFRAPDPGADARGGGSVPFASVAVLPFGTPSGDAGEEYFSEGFAEALTAELAGVDGLHVTSRGSAVRFRRSEAPASRIAAELGVRHLLRGSLLQAGERVRVTVRLVDGPSERERWGATFTGSVAEILALQDSIARHVVREIRVEVGPGEDVAAVGSRGAVHPEAYREYLRGRFFLNRRSPGGFERAQAHFERAIALDPGFPHPHAGLAETYLLLGNYGHRPPVELLDPLRRAALAALARDSAQATARAILGFARFQFEWRFEEGLRELRRALEIEPGNSFARHLYALCLIPLGEFEEAALQEERAFELDPLSVNIAHARGRPFYYARRFDEAIRRYREALELDPSYVPSRLGIADALLEAGREREALESYGRLEGRTVYERAKLAYAYAGLGREAESAKLLAELEELAEEGYVMPYPVAAAYAARGERARAVEWLRRAFAERSDWLVYLHIAPEFDALRGDPVYEELVRRVGVPFSPGGGGGSDSAGERAGGSFPGQAPPEQGPMANSSL